MKDFAFFHCVSTEPGRSLITTCAQCGWMGGTLSSVFWLIQAACPLLIIMLLNIKELSGHFPFIFYSLLESYFLSFLYQWHRRGCVIHVTWNNSYLICGRIKGGVGGPQKLVTFSLLRFFLLRGTNTSRNLSRAVVPFLRSMPPATYTRQLCTRFHRAQASGAGVTGV